MNKIPNEIDITAERMQQAWTAQRDLPKSENKLPRFDPNTDKTDWVVSAFFVSAAETEPKKAKAKKAKTAEPVEAKS